MTLDTSRIVGLVFLGNVSHRAANCFFMCVSSKAMEWAVCAVNLSYEGVGVE